MNYRRIEHRSLVVSTIVNFINTLDGIVIYIITGLNSLLLDSIFSVIGFIASIAAVYIAKNSHKKTEKFPNGMYFLEPLFGVLKSIATLMLLIIAFLESSSVAYAYFTKGEGDPIIKAESKANLIDGLISIGIGATVLMLTFVNINSNLGFLHYTGDFFITVVLVILSIKEPIDILVHSFKEFAYSTVQNQDIKDRVMQVFRENLHEYKHDLDVFIHKQGIHINVRVFVIDIENTDTIEELAEEKANLLNLLRKEFEQISLEFTF
ncbi:cation transporter [Streptococcus didelphis]|uniref:Cation transporter n=1 Tax=Streptococcus didelphis TaxID=102886 RepID=A0ABY9LG05_9STRE|nr:cation transporter [Streptococcus didelphis]WMB27818.1 cation transporter [Streptococcus didelphis]WMB29720.1 cation transporter [Streptococcus didelphis]